MKTKTFDASRPDFMPYGLTCERWTSFPMPRPDRHNEVELNLPLNGSLSYLFGGQRVTLPERSLAAFWAAIPHQIIDSPSKKRTEYYVVTMPLVWYLQLSLPDQLSQPVLHGRMLIDLDEKEFGADCTSFERWAHDLGSKHTERQRAALLEIEARLLRLALALPTEQQSRPKGSKSAPTLTESRLSKAEQMAQFVAQHNTEPLRVEEVSRSVNLHPGYAMTLFQKSFGMTLIEYITHYRITHAQRLLATTNKKILTIAFESGFGSLSRFNDAFRRAAGCSPRQHRMKYKAQ